MVARGHRGKILERFIDQANAQYFKKGWADVRHVPTPVTVIRHHQNRIKDGFFKKGEWVDYIGIVNGRAIAFDAKETRERTRFDFMDLIPEHQYLFLKSWHEKGAISFVMVCFAKHEYETYILPFIVLDQFYQEALEGGRKSIPYSFFAAECERITAAKGIRLHYLRGVI